ncbi:MAG: class II aldolase/adducin family protein [Chloroflexota bacterium]|jgi:L-fuculose-phosphate aldolase
MRSDGQRLRQEIVRVGRLMYEKGFIAASDGNISARLDQRRLLITPSGLHKGMMEPDQLLVVDYDGRKIGPSTAANRQLKPTSEAPMHLEAYRQRPDIQAVVHAHPPITVALSIAGVSLAECLLPEVIVFLGIIPTTAYATPSSEENVAAIRQLIRHHDALVLQRHGSLTVGDSPMQAFMRLETVEQNSRIAYMLKQLGASHPLPADEVRKLLRQRQEMGLSQPGEVAEFCEACGVCHLGDEHPPTLRPGAIKGPRGTAGSPQNLPPISAPAVDQEAVRQLVAQVVRQTMGE